MLAPIVGDLDTPSRADLAGRSRGAALGGFVSDNTFWMFKTLLGLSYAAPFRYTVAQAVLAFVGLGAVLVLSIFV